MKDQGADKDGVGFLFFSEVEVLQRKVAFELRRVLLVSQAVILEYFATQLQAARGELRILGEHDMAVVRGPVEKHCEDGWRVHNESSFPLGSFCVGVVVGAVDVLDHVDFKKSYQVV